MHSSVLAFLNIGSSEMVLIVFVALLLFGGEKLPEIARGLGKGIRDFKDASEGVKREINNQINNFEEKREEEKRVEQATAENQQTAQNQTSEGSTRFQPVENTVPVNDSHFATEDHHVVESHVAGEVVPFDDTHAGEHPGHVTENHTTATHNDAVTAEPTKNT